MTCLEQCPCCDGYGDWGEPDGHTPQQCMHCQGSGFVQVEEEVVDDDL